MYTYLKLKLYKYFDNKELKSRVQTPLDKK